MSNITIISPKKGVSSPFNNCITSNREDSFSSIVKLFNEEFIVFDFYEVLDVRKGLLKVALNFNPEIYMQEKKYTDLLNRCNTIIGTNIEMPKIDNDGFLYLDHDNTDYSGFIMVPESINIKFTVTKDKSIAIVGNNIVQDEQVFEFPANTYVPVRFIMGTGIIKTDYNGDNIFYSFTI